MSRESDLSPSARAGLVLLGGVLSVYEASGALFVFLVTVLAVGTASIWYRRAHANASTRKEVLTGLAIGVGLWCAIALTFAWSDTMVDSSEATTLPITPYGEPVPAAVVLRHGVLSSIAVALVMLGAISFGRRQRRRHRRPRSRVTEPRN